MSIMGKVFIQIILLIFSAAGVFCSLNYLHGRYSLIGMFAAGLIAGIFLMNLKLNVKNDKLNSYKRELERESISSSESDAKVKVLESKIEVLEKALENALKK